MQFVPIVSSPAVHTQHIQGKFGSRIQQREQFWSFSGEHKHLIKFCESMLLVQIKFEMLQNTLRPSDRNALACSGEERREQAWSQFSICMVICSYLILHHFFSQLIDSDKFPPWAGQRSEDPSPPSSMYHPSQAPKWTSPPMRTLKRLPNTRRGK